MDKYELIDSGLSSSFPFIDPSIDNRQRNELEGIIKIKELNLAMQCLKIFSIYNITT
jgi:hypothetical protein